MTIDVTDTPDGVRTVRLNRPSRRNALNLDMVERIHSAITSAPATTIVLGSNDPKTFSSGVDIRVSDEERAAVSDALYGLYTEMRSTPKIILSSASGDAVGGGAQLLIASDIRIVGPDTVIRFVGPGHGLVVGAWGLPSLIGRGRALDLCLSMRPVTADEALAIGLVDRIVDDPFGDAMQYAREILRLDPPTVAGLKRIVSIGEPDAALLEERRLNSTWDGSLPQIDSQ